MRFSCSLPVDDTGNDDFLSIAAITEMVQAMDKAGLDATYVTDHPAPSGRWMAHGGHATLDPFVTLSIVATASQRIRLHTHILVLAYRNPFVVAKSVATLDRLSGGRFMMGIGTGYLRPEYAALGVPFEERGALTDEAIDVLRKAWTGEPVAYKGKYFEARDAVVQPTPVQTPLPIWAGGNSNRAIRRAVELCEGWSPFPTEAEISASAKTDELSSMEQLREKINYAHELCEKNGRKAPLEICMSTFGNSSQKPHSLGEAAKMIDEYSALAEAGVTWSTMTVPSPSRAAFIENVQWFGENVIAKIPK